MTQAQSNRDSFPLRSGMVLTKPLYHPVSGQVLLATGCVLNEGYIAKIMRLGIVSEAIAAISGKSPRPAPPAQPKPPKVSPTAIPTGVPEKPRADAAPETAATSSLAGIRQQAVNTIKREAHELEGRLSLAIDALAGDSAPDTSLSQAIEGILTPSQDGEVAVGSAMALVEAIIRRIQNLGLTGLPDLRVYGGGGRPRIPSTSSSSP